MDRGRPGSYRILERKGTYYVQCLEDSGVWTIDDICLDQEEAIRSAKIAIQQRDAPATKETIVWEE